MRTLPKGAKNYMTPQGAKTLRDELTELYDIHRPKIVETIAWAASNGDRSENGDYIYGKRRLREIDRRIRYLTQRLDIVEVVDPEKQVGEVIRFGATVTLEDSQGQEKVFSIVGVDEADPSVGRISWISPMAKVLLGHSPGDAILLATPGGEQEFEILEVRYLRLS